MFYGVQLYSLREAIKKEGLEEVLHQIAQIGYDGVEFAGFYQYEAEQLKQILDKYHLKTLGIHANIELLESENLLHYVRVLNIPTITYPFLPEEYRHDLNSIADRLNKIGDFYLKEGVILNYHNHAFEFENQNNIVFDLLDKVKNLYWQPDIFWLSYAKLDSLKMLEEKKSRIKIIHIKELENEIYDSSPIIGNGKAKCKEVIQFARKNDIPYLILESENIGENYQAYLKECLKVFKNQ